MVHLAISERHYSVSQKHAARGAQSNLSRSSVLFPDGEPGVPDLVHVGVEMRQQGVGFPPPPRSFPLSPDFPLQLGPPPAVVSRVKP